MTSDRVSATETATEILEALAEQELAGVTELAQIVDGSKANVYKHLKTLEDADFVRKHKGKYKLGHRFLEFATAAKLSDRIYRVGRYPVTQLGNNTRTTAALVTPESYKGVFIHVTSQQNNRDIEPVEGQHAPLHELTTGLTILSQYNESERQTVFSDLSITSKQEAEVRSQLQSIEQRGIAIQTDNNKIAAVAAPITVDTGDPVGAIGLWKRESANEDERVDSNFEKLVRNTAATVSNRLSFSRTSE